MEQTLTESYDIGRPTTGEQVGNYLTPFLAMDYAPCGTIQQVFQQGVPQPLFRMLPIVLQIARALQYVHNHHTIHCDVKPENILLGPRNEAWLADFGIATTMGSLPRTSYGRQAIRGTVRYMAPEQIRGTPLPASDQYALAVMVYEWLCGAPPFSGSEIAVCVQHVSAPPPRLRERIPSLSPTVERVILKAMEKDPRQRFAHVLEFASALKKASLGQR